MKKRQKVPAQFDFAIDPAKRRSKNGKKIGRPRNVRRKVAHTRRGSVDARHPMHVTLRLARGLPNIRYRAAAAVIEDAFDKANGRFGLAMFEYSAEYSLQPDHIHLLIEFDETQAELRSAGRRWIRDVRHALGRAVKGLLVRIARALNREWGRKGQVFGDRYHVNELRSPREVRNARNYVRRNAHHHGHLNEDVTGDSFSSARPPGKEGLIPVVPARTWLGAVGWRRGSAVAGAG